MNSRVKWAMPLLVLVLAGCGGNEVQSPPLGGEVHGSGGSGNDHWQCEQGEDSQWSCVPREARAAPAARSSAVAFPVAGIAPAEDAPQQSVIATDSGPASSNPVPTDASVQTVEEAAEVETPLVAETVAETTRWQQGDYLVQIAAFRSLSVARKRAGALGLNVPVLASEEADGVWYVLVEGAYATAEAAREGGLAFVAEHPDTHFWVRPAGGLREP